MVEMGARRRKVTTDGEVYVNRIYLRPIKYTSSSTTEHDLGLPAGLDYYDDDMRPTTQTNTDMYTNLPDGVHDDDAGPDLPAVPGEDGEGAMNWVMDLTTTTTMSYLPAGEAEELPVAQEQRASGSTGGISACEKVREYNILPNNNIKIKVANITSVPSHFV